jgi:hypothetical protein
MPVCFYFIPLGLYDELGAHLEKKDFKKEKEYADKS